MHCSDAGQVNGHPIIHVNADHPEVIDLFTSQYFRQFLLFNFTELIQLF